MIKKFFILVLLKKYYSSLKFLLALVSNYFYDFKRFFLFSATNSMYRTKIRHQGRITAHYHVIEKGLSLANPRVGFGKQIVADLVTLLNNYQQKYGLDEVGQVALNVLFAYYQFNLKHDLEDKELYERLTKLKDKASLKKSFVSEGGVILVSKNEINAATSIDFEKFANTRHSVRNFANEEVSLSLIKEAVTIAIKTPSVCNRQTWKVYTFSDEELKQKVLSHQNGNRGFGHQASKILVVTSDLDLFISAAERNQCFIDGRDVCHVFDLRFTLTGLRNLLS